MENIRHRGDQKREDQYSGADLYRQRKLRLVLAQEYNQHGGYECDPKDRKNIHRYRSKALRMVSNNPLI